MRASQGSPGGNASPRAGATRGAADQVSAKSQNRIDPINEQAAASTNAGGRFAGDSD
ncbi:MAG: hypothetical protein AAF958_10215 [Planctomycetota bacterium]